MLSRSEASLARLNQRFFAPAAASAQNDKTQAFIRTWCELDNGLVVLSTLREPTNRRACAQRDRYVAPPLCRVAPYGVRLPLYIPAVYSRPLVSQSLSFPPRTNSPLYSAAAAYWSLPLSLP